MIYRNYVLKCSKKTLIFRLLLFLVTFLLLFLILSQSTGFLTAYAASYTLYSSVNSNDSVVRNLIGIYQNSPNYDPFFEFEVARVSQNEYILFYGKDISAGSYNFFQYTVYPSASGNNYIYSGGEGSNLFLDKHGFVTVGNVENSIASSEANEFKFQYVFIALSFFVVILMIFKVFRQHISSRPSRGWRI